MINRAGTPSTSEIDQVHLLFALGKHFEDDGQYKAAFDAYQRGNDKLESLQFDGALLSQRMRLQTTACTEALFRQRKGLVARRQTPSSLSGYLALDRLSSSKYCLLIRRSKVPKNSLTSRATRSSSMVDDEYRRTRSTHTA